MARLSLKAMLSFAMAIWWMAIFSISTGDGEDTMTATSSSQVMVMVMVMMMMKDGMRNVYIIKHRMPFSI